MVGYILNGEKYYNEVLIRKPQLRYQTKISDENLVYESVNNLKSVGYKINKQVLNFITIYGAKIKLIIDDSYIHPLKERLNKKDKLSKWEKKELEFFNCK